MLRRVLLIVVVLIGGAIVWAWPVLRVFPNPWASIRAEPLGGGVYLLKGGVANAGFVIGDKGVVAIDTQLFQPVARNAVRAITRVTAKPVTTIILTHGDPDHVNGLPAFPRAAEVIAHPAAAAQIVQAIHKPKRWLTAPPADIVRYLSPRSIGRTTMLSLEGVPVTLMHVGPAHTGGDLVIFLPHQRLVFAGDILAPSVGRYPGIHLEEHGSSLGWIATAQAMLRLQADRFVSGHGGVLTRGQVAQRIRWAIARRTRIAGLIDRGLDLEGVKAALRDPEPTGEAALFPTFTETAYQELTQPFAQRR